MANGSSHVYEGNRRRIGVPRSRSPCLERRLMVRCIGARWVRVSSFAVILAGCGASNQGASQAPPLESASHPSSAPTASITTPTAPADSPLEDRGGKTAATGDEAETTREIDLVDAAPSLDKNASPPLVLAVRGALGRAASCGPFLSNDGDASLAAMRCACRSVCNERLAKSASPVNVTIPGGGIRFAIAASGQVETCRFDGEETKVDCKSAAPSIVSLTEATPIDPAPQKLRLANGSTIEGAHREVRHEHGGAPAKVGHGELTFHVTAPTSVELVGAWVVRRHCRSTQWETAKPGVHASFADDSGTLSKRFSLVVGDRSLSVTFDSVDVYQACDHFGIRYRLKTSDGEIEMESPLEVMRIEPLRHH